jgi:hypothetical protein
MYTTKAIAFVDDMDNMLQRQIVIQALGNKIDIEDSLLCMKYASTSFQSIVWMLIFDIVTIKRNVVLLGYENNLA